ncbi:MAG: winged helix-turn-helix transcriptional regulator [Gammaproteobacteria bacterium]|nr:winged helix-turn-helix transcriptional regulator [Gammaproteobacteria bacterium]
MKTKATQPLMDLLFGDYRQSCMALLLLHEDTAYHVREISRLTGVPAGSLHRELQLLANAGLLLRTTIGNLVRYQADVNNPVYPQLRDLFSKTLGLPEVVRRGLLPLQKRIEIAFMPDTAAEFHAVSREALELVVIGTVSPRSVASTVRPLANYLGRDIESRVMTREDFIGQVKARSAEVMQYLEQPRVMIEGSTRMLAELLEVERRQLSLVL